MNGFAFDGSDYNLLLESNENSPKGTALFLASYGSYTDLIDGALNSSSYSQINIASKHSTAGLVAFPDFVVDASDLDDDNIDVAQVPEPGTLGILSLGLFTLLMNRRKVSC